MIAGDRDVAHLDIISDESTYGRSCRDPRCHVETSAGGASSGSRYLLPVPELIAPTVRFHAEWLATHVEWGPGAHEDGFGLSPSDDVASPIGFTAWVRRLLDQSDPAKASAMGRVPCNYWWIVEDTQVLGGIALRHGLNETVEQLGHIGFGIRPSARRRGLATWALGRVLDEARALDLDRVLLVCEENNAASAKTIQRLSGILEPVRETEQGPARRYWITL